MIIRINVPVFISGGLSLRHNIVVSSALGAAMLLFFSAGEVAAQQKLRPTTRAATNQDVEFDIYLPLQHADQLDQLLTELQTPGSPNYHKWLTPQQFSSRFGPKSEDIARVADVVRSNGSTITKVHSHGVHVQGKVEAVERTFGVSLWNTVTANGHPRMMTPESLSVPSELSELGAQVVGLSSAFEFRSNARRTNTVPDNRYTPAGPYWFDDLKQAYDFPSYKSLTGKGVTLAIMSISDYQDSDMDLYFGHEKLKTPTIARFPIAGGTPFDPLNGNSIEAELDLQQAGGMAPGATLVLVNLPDGSDASFIGGYLTLVEGNFADVVNTSFSGPEALYTAAYNGGTDFTGVLRVFDELFKQGNAEGITFVASSGDLGGVPVPPLEYFTTPPKKTPAITGHFLPGVEFFASSPHVTAVGGTNLITTSDPPSLESKYVTENAYGDPLIPFDPYGIGNSVEGGYWGSGGGKSVVFPKPPYQFLVETRSDTRAVPDVSLQMGGCPGGLLKGPCPSNRSAVLEVFAGQLIGVIGTSVSAPDFAGLLALKIQHLGQRLGNENYDIYSLAAKQQNGSAPFPFFHEKIPGFDGFYHTDCGYDFVTGNGTVNGRNFLLVPKAPPAGNPQTPSNP
jgi:subtilase family serine protease